MGKNVYPVPVEKCHSIPVLASAIHVLKEQEGQLRLHVRSVILGHFLTMVFANLAQMV